MQDVEPGSTLATITAPVDSHQRALQGSGLGFHQVCVRREGIQILAKTGTIPAIMTDDMRVW